MIAYRPEDITVTINGQGLDCLTQISLSEASGIFSVPNPTVEWKDIVVNLQSWEVSLSGTGLDGHQVCRTLFRTKNQVTFRLSTNDGEIIQQGLAIFVEVKRSYSEDDGDFFGARLIGVGIVEELTDLNFLLQEDGFYILQESGSRIKI